MGKVARNKCCWNTNGIIKPFGVLLTTSTLSTRCRLSFSGLSRVGKLTHVPLGWTIPARQRPDGRSEVTCWHANSDGHNCVCEKQRLFSRITCKVRGACLIRIVWKKKREGPFLWESSMLKGQQITWGGNLPTGLCVNVTCEDGGLFLFNGLHEGVTC